MSHECNSCTGNKYDGANIKCQLCLKPYFVECLEKIWKRKEITELTNSVKSQTFSSGANRLQTKFQALFNDSSTLLFMCPTCKQSGTLRDILEAYKTQTTIEYTNKIQLLEKRDNEIGVALIREKDTVANMVLKVNQLEQDIECEKNIKLKLNNDVIELNVALEQEKSMVIQLNEQIATQAQQLVELNEQIKLQAQQLADLNEKLNSNGTVAMDGIEDENYDQLETVNELHELVKKEMCALTQELEARISVECDKLKDVIKNVLNDHERSGKRKKTSNPSGNSTFLNIGNSVGNMHAPRFVTNLPVISGHLIPCEVETNDVIDKDVYEIHVSKFSTAQTEEGIVKHIIEKTGVNRIQFRVIKLMKRNYTSRNASFKIVTLDRNVYEKIYDTELWNGYDVRDFEREKPKNWSNNRGMNNNPGNKLNGQRRGGLDLRRNVLQRNAAQMHRRYEGNSDRNQQMETPRRPSTPSNARVWNDSPRNVGQRPPRFNQPRLNQPPRFNQPPRYNQTPRFDQTPHFQPNNNDRNFINNGRQQHLTNGPWNQPRNAQRN